MFLPLYLTRESCFIMYSILFTKYWVPFSWNVGVTILVRIWNQTSLEILSVLYRQQSVASTSHYPASLYQSAVPNLRRNTPIYYENMFRIITWHLHFLYQKDFPFLFKSNDLHLCNDVNLHWSWRLIKRIHKIDKFTVVHHFTRWSRFSTVSQHCLQSYNRKIIFNGYATTSLFHRMFHFFLKIISLIFNK